jgi:glutathione-regulated potassium-efflux system ancillary protein KefG
MTPTVRTEDLIDARGIAELLGLSHPNSVSTYLRRYPDMPRPVVDLGRGRPRLWLRPHIADWADRRAAILPTVPLVPTAALPAVPVPAETRP